MSTQCKEKQQQKLSHTHRHTHAYRERYSYNICVFCRTFRWKFNNSGETLDVGSERFSVNGSRSILKYTPVTDQVNSRGHQLSNTQKSPTHTHTHRHTHAYIIYSILHMYLQDYGTLSCWAANEVGTQQHPCLFQVVLAGKFKLTRIPCNYTVN